MRIRTRVLMVSMGTVCLYAMGGPAAIASPFYAGWQVVAPAGGGFSVEMPGMPHASTHTIDTAAGPAIVHRFTYETSTEAYLAEYDEFKMAMDAQKMLEGARDGVGKVANIIFDTPVTLNGHPGKMITGTSNGKTFLAAIYVAGSRMYQVVYVGSPTDAVLHGGPFLKSFELAR